MRGSRTPMSRRLAETGVFGSSETICPSPVLQARAEQEQYESGDEKRQACRDGDRRESELSKIIRSGRTSAGDDQIIASGDEISEHGRPTHGGRFRTVSDHPCAIERRDRIIAAVCERDGCEV